MSELKKTERDNSVYFPGGNLPEINYKTYIDYVRENEEHMTEYMKENSKPVNEGEIVMDKHLDPDINLYESFFSDQEKKDLQDEQYFQDQKKKYYENLTNVVTVKSRKFGSKLAEKSNSKNKKTEQDYKPFNYFPTISKPKPIEKKSAPEPEISINKNEELIINIEELADELAIENQKDKNDNKEYSELLKKYKKLILKHERTKKQ